MWIWLVLLYGVLKGAREICKKKALEVCTSIEVLLIYTFISFLLVCPDFKNALGLEPKYFIYIFIKSLVIFVAWIFSFKAVKQLPLSLYGVLDLSRVLFATLLGVVVLGEVMEPLNIVGLILVSSGLLLLKFRPSFIIKRISSKDGPEEKVSPLIVIIALASCMLNSISGLLDKLLMKDISSSQLQFWYMLFLVILYIIYAIADHTEVNFKRAFTNKWIWLMSIMFVIADRSLFIANASADSQITIMTLLKQAGCIVTILGGKYIFKEKNTTYKFICAGIIIVGIFLTSFCVIN